MVRLLQLSVQLQQRVEGSYNHQASLGSPSQEWLSSHRRQWLLGPLPLSPSLSPRDHEECCPSQMFGGTIYSQLALCAVKKLCNKPPYASAPYLKSQDTHQIYEELFAPSSRPVSVPLELAYFESAKTLWGDAHHS